MIKEMYSTNKLILILKEDSIEVKYLGTSYCTEYNDNVVDCLARILNTIKCNAHVICLELINIINIMEPPQQKSIKFDGFKYIAE